MSLHMLGAGIYVGAAYTDKATVERVQRFILGLPKAKQLPEAQPLSKAVLAQKNAFGALGPTTKTAVRAFNVAYGWESDGESITDGTLEAMKRPDLRPDYVAAVETTVAKTQQIVAQAEAVQTPAQVQVVKQSTAAVVAKAQEQAPPELKAAVAEAQASVQQASTPPELRLAIAEVQKIVGRVQEKANTSPATESWFTRETLIPPVPNYGVIGGGVAVLAALWYFFKQKAVSTVTAAVGGAS